MPDEAEPVPPPDSPTGPSGRLAGWLFLPTGQLPTIRRVTGGLLLCIMPEVLFWSHGGPGPYHVPAWRVGGAAIDLPLPPPWLDAATWALYAAAALAMVLGRRDRVFPALAAAVLAYYGGRDNRACNSSYIQLLFTYLVAFLFSREPVSASRRLIQVSLSSCYLFSAIQKLAMSEWRLGHTIAGMLTHGDGIRPALLPLVQASAPLAGLAWLMAPGVVLVEAFIGAGLWFPRTRRAAMGLGILLHLGFSAFLPGTEIFAPVMLIGYLAFLDGGPPAASDPRPRSLETALAVATLAVLLAIPARIYLPPMRPWHLLSHMDHLPWTYSMFAQVDHQDSIEIAYVDRAGMRHAVEPSGRMDQATADADLHALTRDLLRRHPEAESAEVHLRLTINHRRGLDKLVTARRGQPPSTVVRELPVPGLGTGD